VERIYVDARVYDDFVAGFADLTRKYVVGNPLEQATTLGPMARASFADTVRAQVAEAKRKGATPLINMKVKGDTAGSPYLAPEMLVNVNHQMEVMREESFGPVGIMKARDDDEAVMLMNDNLRTDRVDLTRDTIARRRSAAGSKPARCYEPPTI
jgi:acyl-CoA reductase-like NAD-dependent aldehyde dehydrogenase